MIFIQGFVAGWGTMLERTCRTNKKGPEIYSTCAYGFSYMFKGKLKNNTRERCLSGDVKVVRDDYPCYGFNQKSETNYQVFILSLDSLPKASLKFRTNDEIVLVPKNRTLAPRACYKRETNYEEGKNIAEHSRGWCGTCNPKAKKNSKSGFIYNLFKLRF